MFQLTKLRNELNFNKEIGGIINVLKGVASSEFYRLQKARKKLDEFGDYLQTFFRMVNIAGARHLFLEDSSLPRALLLITSDIGFLGKLNVAIVNSALEQYSGNEKLIIVGKQGAGYIEETGKSFTSFGGITDEVDYKEVETLTNFIVKGFLNKEFGRTVIIYSHFTSFALWRVQNYQLLPCRFLLPVSSGSEVKD
ncbi:MAG: FoF1 ATP synthase subunit gamma, partial [Candidatus Omnitrophota bacterium]|nr:FoF1 ATP synthase subunit gamma [Candidatus Omnitrophota bacterium]